MGPILCFDCLQNSYFTSKIFILKFYNLQNIYIFIKKHFPFQKKYFLYAIKNIFEAKFHLFFYEKSSIFSSKKSPKITQKNFSKCFLAKMQKKICPGPPPHLSKSSIRVWKIMKCLKKKKKKKKTKTTHFFLFSFFFSSVSRN